MLLFLPGLICDARTFAAQTAAFAGSRAVDGYGPASRPADTIPAMAQAVLEEADEAGAASFDLFGHSMGGRVALEVVRLAPPRVRRLALVSTGIHPLGDNEPAKRAALQQVGHEHGFAALVDRWLPPMVAEQNRAREEVYAPIRAMCLSAGQDRFDAQIAALIGRPDLDALLPQIACPTLVMTGALDQWAPPAQHEAIAARLAQAQLVVVPGAGHMLPLEAPTKVNAAIAQWLAMPASA